MQIILNTEDNINFRATLNGQSINFNIDERNNKKWEIGKKTNNEILKYNYQFIFFEYIYEDTINKIYNEYKKNKIMPNAYLKYSFKIDGKTTVIENNLNLQVKTSYIDIMQYK